jgi:hypothetical protein
MLLGPIVAPFVRLKVASMVVEFTTTVVPPAMVKPFAGAVMWMVVPVAVKPVPVKTTACPAPRMPEAGAIEARVGVPGRTTVNVTGVVVPVGVVTVTFLAVSAAVAETVKVAVMVVSFTTVKLGTVMPLPPPPPPPETLTDVAPVRLTPVKVTVSLVPLAPVFGAIENSPAGGTVTVNVTALLVPPGPVVVTFLAPAVAPGEKAKVAVIVVSLTTVMPETLTPLPDTLTEVVPVKPVPVSVTAIGLGVPKVPRIPDTGVIDVSTGPVIVKGTGLLLPPAVPT